MSDPVTNVEIEDVLSSIRRLVSTDGRSDTQPDEHFEATPEKLVLTPSLRVTDIENPSQDASDPVEDQVAELEHTEETAEDHHGHFDHEDATAKADDGTPKHDVWADEDEDNSPDYFELQGEDQLPDDVENETARDPQEDPAENLAEDDIAEDQVKEPLFEEDAALESENAGREDNVENLGHIAEIEDAVAARDDGWEPDGKDDDNAAHPMEVLNWEDTAAAAFDDTDADTDIEIDTEIDTEIEIDVSEIEDAVVIAATEGLDAFELLEDDDLPLEPASLEPASLEPASPEPEQAAVNGFNVDDDPLSDDEAYLDEDVLRDLVTEIVRQELQGALGERITRNVRKLVRREINRALATQELE